MAVAGQPVPALADRVLAIWAEHGSERGSFLPFVTHPMASEPTKRGVVGHELGVHVGGVVKREEM